MHSTQPIREGPSAAILLTTRAENRQSAQDFGVTAQDIGTPCGGCGETSFLLQVRQKGSTEQDVAD